MTTPPPIPPPPRHTPGDGNVPSGHKPLKKKFVRREAGAQGETIRCQSCGSPLELRDPARAQLLTCTACGAVLDLSGDEQKILRKVLLEQTPYSPLPLGSKGTLKGVEWEVIGRLVMKGSDSEETWFWDEFLLFSPTQGYAWLEAGEGVWKFLRKARGKPGFDPRHLVIGYRPFGHQGESYRVTERDFATVDYIHGEFPYIPEIGARSEYVDTQSRTGQLLVAEWTANEVEWLTGKIYSPQEIQKAFNLKEMPKTTSAGVGGFLSGARNSQKSAETNLAVIVIVVIIVFFLCCSGAGSSGSAGGGSVRIGSGGFSSFGGK
ncbi:MAG: DUF4178 domain-containing protein [Sumerlaeia bacterium]